MVLFFDYNDGMAYADSSLKSSMQFGGGFPGNLRWLESRDTKTRMKMMELQRQGWPAGEALNEALIVCREDWQSMARVVPSFQALEGPSSMGAEGPGGGRPTVRPRSRSRERKGKGKGKKGDRPQGGNGDSRPASTLPGGKNLCSLWNAGKCEKDHTKCPRKHWHLCNFRFPDSSVCGKRHRRCDEH